MILIHQQNHLEYLIIKKSHKIINMKKSIIFILVLIFINGNLYSQCFPDRHNTNWFDSWISCETAPNPNQSRGDSHWILYNLNHKYKLGQMHVWNTNSTDILDYGLREVLIDISDDGINWTEIGLYNFEKSEGFSTYEGFDGPNLEGLEAKFVLLTALSNWGGSCYGLSEIRIDVNGTVSNILPPDHDDCISVELFPNPIVNNSKVKIKLKCGNDIINYSIQDITGKVVLNGQSKPINYEAVIENQFLDLAAGSYIFSLKQNNISVKKKLIKLK